MRKYLTWQEFKVHRDAGTLRQFGLLYQTDQARFEYASWWSLRKYQLEILRLRNKFLCWVWETRFGWVLDWYFSTKQNG